MNEKRKDFQELEEALIDQKDQLDRSLKRGFNGFKLYIDSRPFKKSIERVQAAAKEVALAMARQPKLKIVMPESRINKKFIEALTIEVQRISDSFKIPIKIEKPKRLEIHTGSITFASACHSRKMVIPFRHKKFNDTLTLKSFKRRLIKRGEF